MTNEETISKATELFLNIGKAAAMPKEAQDVAIDVAAQQMGQGQFLEALRSYTALTICNPSNMDAHVGLANCLLELNAADLALQSACVAMRLQPNNPAAYYLSGKACWMLGHHAEAIEDLNDAINFSVKARNSKIGNEAKRLLKAIEASTPAH